MKRILAAAIVVIIFFSCKKSKNAGEPTPICITGCPYSEIFAFRLVDKNTGADLIYGSNPPYTPNDIKLFSDAGRTAPLFFHADSISKVIYMYLKREMYLEIKGTDVYKLSVTGLWITCCVGKVKELWQDGKLLCSGCAEVISVPIK